MKRVGSFLSRTKTYDDKNNDDHANDPGHEPSEKTANVRVGLARGSSFLPLLHQGIDRLYCGAAQSASRTQWPNACLNGHQLARFLAQYIHRQSSEVP
jgi:hypothetical protein